MDLRKSSIGIELGSTRIKAVLIDEHNIPVASGGHDWENKLENGVWTYDLPDVISGVQSAYKSLCEDFGEPIIEVSSIGISAMMHGYLVFDKADSPLCEFRTWRNTITEKSSRKLTKLFGFNIPQRWSIAHLYQAVLNKEKHIVDIKKMTTLAGYVHFLLTGENVLGVGDASGVFPIQNNNYDVKMVEKFKAETEIDLLSILPKVMLAGENAGHLTKEGALRLDPTGNLKAGIPFCPPEGDAGTGMVATNAVTPRTGNVSAGTSVFAMIVLENNLAHVFEEIDIVTTPAGSPVAMVHCNNCSSDIDAWARLFQEFSTLIGCELKMGKVLDSLFENSLKGDDDCGGNLAYNYFSGEHITGFNEGRPLFVKTPSGNFNLANFFKSHIYTAVASLKVGLDILKKERVNIDKLLGHGGYFKAENVGQLSLSAAAGVPVSVMETAGEGGAYGMALLAAYSVSKCGKSLDEYLADNVFADAKISTVSASESQIEGFNRYFDRFIKGLEIEKSAIENFN